MEAGLWARARAEQQSEALLGAITRVGARVGVGGDTGVAHGGGSSSRSGDIGRGEAHHCGLSFSLRPVRVTSYHRTLPFLPSKRGRRVAAVRRTHAKRL